MFSKKIALSIVLALSILSISYSVLFIFKDEKLYFWVREDGILETGGAIMYLLASVILIYLYIKSKSGSNLLFFKTKRNIFLLLLGLLMFICFGEEISWGQRLFHIESPEILKEINAQKEFNIHNLNIFHGRDAKGAVKVGLERWYNMDRLFSIFWFLYCFVIPLTDRSIKSVNKFFRTLNLPIVPLWVGCLFLINYISSKAIERTSVFWGISRNHVVEIKEANIGFLFFVVGLSFYIIFKKESSLIPRG